MPIIDIEMVTERPGPAEPRLSRDLADALGEVLGQQSGKVWVRLRELSYGSYAENNVAKPPYPVFVNVLASAPPEGRELETLAIAITEAVANLTRRPAENVHVIFQPAARGRIAFGGKLSK